MINFNKKLAPNRGPLLVMCSGGIDSIAMAHFLWRANPEVQLFHFNHKLREQNENMALNVKAFAYDKGISLKLRGRSTESQCGYGASSTESGARAARYAALDKVTQIGWNGDLGPNKPSVICCHHLDDCVESYLMNCFNGVPEYSPIPINTARIACNIYRPFLLTEKSSLISYVKKNGLMKYVVEDETNTDYNIRRNFVRHELRPLIETRWVGLKKVVKKKVLSEYSKYSEEVIANE